MIDKMEKRWPKIVQFELVDPVFGLMEFLILDFKSHSISCGHLSQYHITGRPMLTE